MNGQPSPRSIGVWWYLFHAISNNRKIEFYMIYQDNFDSDVKGLYQIKRHEVSISYKHIENACLADYFLKEKKYPDWNKQENHEKWDDEIEMLHTITKQNKNKDKRNKNLDFAKTLKEKGIETKIKRSADDY